MKTRYKHGDKFRKKEYGIGGAVMTLGKNLLQGKKFGSGALKGVLRAGITPGSGIGAGIGLAGAGLAKIGEKTGREGLQKLGKGVGMAGNIAGMFTGGGGGAGAAGALGKGGIDTFLHGAGKQVQGGVLPFLAQKFMAEDGMRVPVRLLKKGGKVYENGGKLDVNDLLESLEVKNPELMSKAVELVESDDKRGLNKLLNQAHREELKSAEEEGYADLKTERKKKRDERKRLNQAFFDEMKSDDPGMEEEGGGGMGKEDWRKILQALAGGTLGFGAMAVIPKIVKLLKQDDPTVESDALYHNILDPRPDYINRLLTRTPNQLSGGKNQ